MENIVWETTYIKAPPLSPLEHDMSVCWFRKNRTETRHNTACQQPGKRVPGASHRNRIPQRRITVGGVWAIVHDVPPGQPTVAKPLINYVASLGTWRNRRKGTRKRNTHETSDGIEIREGSTSMGVISCLSRKRPH